MEDRKFEPDITRLHVIPFGHGPRTLVMLPGISLCGLAGMGPQVAAAYADFCDDYTVYLFDWANVLPAGYHAADMARDVAAALAQRGVQTADVFGVSHGGMLAQVLAWEHPELVRRLVLASTTAHPSAMAQEIVMHWCRLAEAADVRGLNRSFAQNVYSPQYYETYRDIFAAMETGGTPEDCARFAILCSSVLSFDSTAHLAGITCPTLVIGAKGDRIFGPEASEELAKGIGCGLYLYDGYGHAVYDEAPDYKARLLRFFLGK